MSDSNDYWFNITGENDSGIDSGLMKSPDDARMTNSIEVPSIDEYLNKVTENGGKVVVPKTTIPNMGYFAYCIDNQGLLFGVSEVNSKA